MRKRFERLKDDQKGFTLVELIVVLVILAIMAALLAPALLGYIDKARNSKYLEECRAIVTAVQAVNDERYAKGGDEVKLTETTDINAVNDLVYPTKVTTGTVKYKTSGTGASDKEKARDKYIVDYISSVTFVSQDGTTVTATMASASSDWEVTPNSSSSSTCSGTGTGTGAGNTTGGDSNTGSQGNGS